MKADITTLGERKIVSPLDERYKDRDTVFVEDDEKIISSTSLKKLKSLDNLEDILCFEKAGPRRKIFFDSSKVKSAIVTCGGLCPGLNDVIRSIVMESYFAYGAENIIGIKYGYNGLLPNKKIEPIELNPDVVDHIHTLGGTILASSRGGTDDMETIVDSLERLNVNILYAIGGDGTQKGARQIAEIALKRGLKMSVIGIPKTIDNDLNYISKSFGFETAFSEAVISIHRAHNEAKGAPNGIGLVKLMGRESGFIAASAALAMSDVNFCLIPEVPFELYGENGFLAHLEKRIIERKHAVICVAEGAGQDLILEENVKADASGNKMLKDIGIFLKEKIANHFEERKIEANIKYIDPSYLIRSAPANANDSLFCALLGQFAVHAGMAGKTNMIVGTWNDEFIHLPIELVTSERNKIDPHSRFWFSVLQSTGQAPHMTNE